MIAELHEVLSHQHDAAVCLEDRLRDVEVLLAVDEPRSLSGAVLAANDAAERLAALELTRVLTVTSFGAPPDISARELFASHGGEAASSVTALVHDVRTAVARVALRRERVRGLLGVDGARRVTAEAAQQLS